jgi:hypothetical protein
MLVSFLDGLEQESPTGSVDRTWLENIRTLLQTSLDNRTPRAVQISFSMLEHLPDPLVGVLGCCWALWFLSVFVGSLTRSLFSQIPSNTLVHKGTHQAKQTHQHEDSITLGTSYRHTYIHTNTHTYHTSHTRAVIHHSYTHTHTHTHIHTHLHKCKRTQYVSPPISSTSYPPSNTLPTHPLFLPAMQMLASWKPQAIADVLTTYEHQLFTKVKLEVSSPHEFVLVSSVTDCSLLLPSCLSW